MGKLPKYRIAYKSKRQVKRWSENLAIVEKETEKYSDPGLPDTSRAPLPTELLSHTSGARHILEVSPLHLLEIIFALNLKFFFPFLSLSPLLQLSLLFLWLPFKRFFRLFRKQVYHPSAFFILCYITSLPSQNVLTSVHFLICFSLCVLRQKTEDWDQWTECWEIFCFWSRGLIVRVRSAQGRT